MAKAFKPYVRYTDENGKQKGIEVSTYAEVKRRMNSFMKDSFDVSHPTDILYTIMTRFEVRHLRNLVLEYDSNAFIFTNIIKEAAGGVLLKRKGDH